MVERQHQATCLGFVHDHFRLHDSHDRHDGKDESLFLLLSLVSLQLNFPFYIMVFSDIIRSVYVWKLLLPRQLVPKS